MRDTWFTLTSGREVELEQFEVRKSDLEFFEGVSERIRADVLIKLPKEVRARFGHTGFLLREPPPGPLPDYTFLASLHCYKPVKPNADCSSLVLCWFDHSLPESIRASVALQLETLDWDKYAKDGLY